ncbi:MAG: MFS transporter [Pseudomonadota bacterium]
MKNRLFNLLAIRPSVLAMLGMVALVGLGERLAERFLPIYLLALGSSIYAVGLLSGLQNLLGALYSFPGGYLSSRLGYKKALLIFNLMAMAGFLIVAVFPYWQAVLVGAFFFIAWSAISLPASMDLISQLVPKEKRAMGVSLHSLIRRFPMALGPVIGGLFIAYWGEKNGVRLAFLLALILALVAIFFQQKFISEENKKNDQQGEKNPFKLYSLMTMELRQLLVSDILIRFCEQIPQAFVVIWCMKIISSPVTAPQFGLLTTIEMATAVLIYLPVAYYADRVGKRPFVIITFIFFSLFPLLLMFSQHFSILVIAFIIRGLKEFGEPSRKAMIMDLAPEDLKASMFGLYYLIRDSVVSLAAFGGAFLWGISPRVNLLSAFVFGILGTLWFVKNTRTHDS